MLRAAAALLLVTHSLACSDASGKDVVVRPAKVVPGTTPYTGDQNYFPDDRAASDPELAVHGGGGGGAGAGAAQATSDASKGDKQDAEWVPAEHKVGGARWKDTGVYVDGKPVGFLTWGELPITLKPTWVRDKVSANKRPGTNDPGWRWAQQRFYRFTDYLKAVGVDLRTVREVHVNGPRLSQTIIATGKDLQSPLAKDFMFRFGGNVFGKAIPHVPDGFASGRPPDKIAGVMVYVHKKPPTLVPNEGLELDGVLQTGVPYFGEPIRGGIRIYLDTKLAGIIKRQELDPKQATKASNGELEWRLADVFRAQGIDTSRVVEAWIIRDDRRREKLPASELAALTFQAGAQAKGGILLKQSLRANALALSTRPIQDAELPIVTPDDD